MQGPLCQKKIVASEETLKKAIKWNLAYVIIKSVYTQGVDDRICPHNGRHSWRITFAKYVG